MNPRPSLWKAYNSQIYFCSRELQCFVSPRYNWSVLHVVQLIFNALSGYLHVTELAQASNVSLICQNANFLVVQCYFSLPLRTQWYVLHCLTGIHFAFYTIRPVVLASVACATVFVAAVRLRLTYGDVVMTTTMIMIMMMMKKKTELAITHVSFL